MWCVNVGYGRNEIAEVMADQARQLAYANPFVDMTNPLQLNWQRSLQN